MGSRRYTPSCKHYTLSSPGWTFHQADARKLLRHPRRLSLHATAADRVVLESYKGSAEVVEVNVYGPTSA